MNGLNHILVTDMIYRTPFIGQPIFSFYRTKHN